MSKKIQPNRYKPDSQKGRESESGIFVCLKSLMTFVFICVLSLASIFLYDVITQSVFFNIKKIEITGTKRVLKEELIKLADLDFEKKYFKD